MYVFRTLALSLMIPVVSLSGGCGGEDSEPAPTPPNVRATLERYLEPAGELTAQNAPAAIEDFATGLVDVADALLLLEFTFELVSQWGQAGQSSDALTVHTREDGLLLGEQRQGQSFSFSAGGWGRLRHQCGGWGDGLQGRLELTNVFNIDNGLGETFWGNLRDCHLTLGDRQVRFDGSIQLLTPFQDPEAGFLLVLEGTSQRAEDAVKPLSLELRLDGEEVQMRQPLPSGEDIIVAVPTSGLDTLAVTIRGARTWQCSVNETFTGGSCTDEEGGSFDW
ncbi:MAG: hypothetical protein ACE366_02200 [Bradymonadia bacterium]